MFKFNKKSTKILYLLSLFIVMLFVVTEINQKSSNPERERRGLRTTIRHRAGSRGASLQRRPPAGGPGRPGRAGQKRRMSTSETPP